MQIFGAKVHMHDISGLFAEVLEAFLLKYMKRVPAGERTVAFSTGYRVVACQAVGVLRSAAIAERLVASRIAAGEQQPLCQRAVDRRRYERVVP